MSLPTSEHNLTSPSAPKPSLRMSTRQKQEPERLNVETRKGKPYDGVASQVDQVNFNPNHADRGPVVYWSQPLSMRQFASV